MTDIACVIPIENPKHGRAGTRFIIFMRGRIKNQYPSTRELHINPVPSLTLEAAGLGTTKG